jgi:hypothetical protein
MIILMIGTIEGNKIIFRIVIVTRETCNLVI